MPRPNVDPTLPVVRTYITQHAFDEVQRSGITGAISANPERVRAIVGPVPEVAIVIRAGWRDSRFVRDTGVVYINGDHLAYPTYAEQADIQADRIIEMTTSAFDPESLDDAFLRAVAKQKLHELRRETAIVGALFLGGSVGAVMLTEYALDPAKVWLASGVFLGAALLTAIEHSHMATEMLQRRPVV